ncbi:MAG: hypothetical protein ACYCWN_03555 [Ferrimicrobium sp.]|jgi:hypothetical protein|uniref:Methylguanine DNA methyltransferase ribonuclease-like domain-containing protein n=1 Tax=Ferrimicrobium acidiphilum TaxID=121039 RepID=A0ABV3Y387_9ACTN|nr:hypothetical protein [Ferrimicrobium sp.]
MSIRSPIPNGALTIDSPLGPIALGAAGHHLVGVDFLAASELSHTATNISATLLKAARQLDANFAGNLQDIALPTHAASTDFQQHV